MSVRVKSTWRLQPKEESRSRASAPVDGGDRAAPRRQSLDEHAGRGQTSAPCASARARLHFRGVQQAGCTILSFYTLTSTTVIRYWAIRLQFFYSNVFLLGFSKLLILCFFIGFLNLQDAHLSWKIATNNVDSVEKTFSEANFDHWIEWNS